MNNTIAIQIGDKIKLIANYPNITYLDLYLYSNNIGDAGAVGIGNGIAALNTTKLNSLTLYFMCNNLTE